MLARKNKWLVWLLAFITVGLALAQAFSIVAVFGMLHALRKNVSSFTAKTYRLHRQLTFLLLAQVLHPQYFHKRLFWQVFHPPAANATKIE